MNGVKLIYRENAFIVKDNIDEFSDVFINFLTNPNIKYGEIEEDENKFKRFLFDIGYDLGKGDKKSARYRGVKRIIRVKDDVYGRGLNSTPNQITAWLATNKVRWITTDGVCSQIQIV